MTTTSGLLLAAGQSRRFGGANKLLAPLEGQPLVAHAAQALMDTGFAPLVAVVADPGVARVLDGFELVWIGAGTVAQSRSLAAGVAAAARKNPDRLVVALGDMPRVTARLLVAVGDRCARNGAASAHDGSRPMPPAAFDRSRFSELERLTGDRGAVALLRNLPTSALVPAPVEALVDIDTEEDLARLQSAEGGVTRA
ncbi:MAG: nucleotidyltransferase family protein [Pseudomonadota bacterium]